MKNRDNQSKTATRYIEIDGTQIPVTEEVYRAYKRPVWAERKRKEREKRCSISNGKGGIKRCEGDCSKCKERRTGTVLSLDKIAEAGIDVKDPADMTEMVANRLLLEQLFRALGDLESEEQSLVDALFLRNRTERDYAAEIDISHQAVGKRKKKVIEKLRNQLRVDEP